jgi:hypothetical protein
VTADRDHASATIGATAVLSKPFRPALQP